MHLSCRKHPPQSNRQLLRLIELETQGLFLALPENVNGNDGIFGRSRIT